MPKLEVIIQTVFQSIFCLQNALRSVVFHSLGICSKFFVRWHVRVGEKIIISLIPRIDFCNQCPFSASIFKLCTKKNMCWKNVTCSIELNEVIEFDDGKSYIKLIFNYRNFIENIYLQWS